MAFRPWVFHPDDHASPDRGIKPVTAIMDPQSLVPVPTENCQPGGSEGRFNTPNLTAEPFSKCRGGFRLPGAKGCWDLALPPWPRISIIRCHIRIPTSKSAPCSSDGLMRQFDEGRTF